MKLKSSMTLVVMMVISLVLSACQVLPFIDVVRGSGNLTTQTRDVSGFNEIQLDGAGRLVITQGDAESLEIEAEDNLINELTSDVEAGVLELGYAESPLRRRIVPTRRIVYTLTVTDLTLITINGAADLEIDSLETQSFELAINGAGRTEIEGLAAEELDVIIRGAGSINIAGEVPVQSITIEGAGNYQAGDLQTSDTTVTINGAGNSVVWATESLDIVIRGGGNVSYYGSPEVTRSITGAGDIRSRGEK